MSCAGCERAQEEGITYFIRWKNANILLSGCREHITEVMMRIRGEA